MRLMTCTAVLAAAVLCAETEYDAMAAGTKALGKGLHHKAFEHFRTAHRQLGGQSAWEHVTLQEGLCVCAAKLRKERVAVSACENASSLRDADATSSHALLMAQGEARLMATPPDAKGAWQRFHAAAAVARRGEALRLEREAEAALRRAEERLYASFTLAAGRPADGATRLLARRTVRSVEEALAACAAWHACGVASMPVQRGARFEVSLVNATGVTHDAHLAPKMRQVSYVRDVKLNYQMHRDSELRTSTTRAAMTIGQAMHLCDAQAGTPAGCAGFVVSPSRKAHADGYLHPEKQYDIRIVPGSSSKPVIIPSPRFTLFLRGEAPPAGKGGATDESSRGAKAKGGSAGAKEGSGKGDANRKGGASAGGRGSNTFRGGFGGGFDGGFGGGFGGSSSDRQGRGFGGFGAGAGGRGSSRGTTAPPTNAARRRDYYAILHVGKDASAREIKKAYHKMAMKWHPDKNRAAGQEKRLEKAERNFKLIARAYEVLGNEKLRADYDNGVDVDAPLRGR